MTVWEIVIISVSLGMDAFAISLAVGSRGTTKRQKFRLSFHFGLFQFLMPVIGGFLGSRLLHVIKAFDHWVAFSILFLIGAHMIYESFTPRRPEVVADPTRGWRLVLLSLACSIDALGVGVSFGVLALPIWYPCVVIGIVASAMTLTGMILAAHLSARIGRWFETLGGAILIVLAVRALSL